MITTVMFVAFGLLLLTALWRTVRGNASAVKSLEELEASTQAVDLEAFRNLISRDEGQFLRANLSPKDFRKVHRARTWAALDYVRRIAFNAAILIRLGEAARTSDNHAVATAAQKLATDALQLRLLTLRAQAKLYAEILIPEIDLRYLDIAEEYDSLIERVSLLIRLQMPAQAARIRTSL